VFPQRIERVWEASGPADLAQALRATASLGESGLALEIDNRMGQTLGSPLIVWHGRALAMDDVPAGASTVTAFRANALGDFTSGGVLASDEAKRRGRIVAASLAPAKGVMLRPEPGNEVPMLVGWLADGGTPLLRPGDREVARGKSLVMVRAPVQIAPQKTGTKVSVPAALVKLDTGRMPYELDKGESVATPQPGQWLVSFAVPAEVGRLRPTGATLRLRVTLPGHDLIIRKDQCGEEGSPKSHPFATPVAAWDRTVGSEQVHMDLSPRDVDGEGRVWLLFDVHSVGAVSGGNPLSWQIKDLELSLDAEVVGPPEAINFGTATRPTSAAGPDEQEWK
jgi:hypothetical protein